MNKLRIGTRGSPLAMVQAKTVEVKLLECNPYLEIEIITIKTAGDKITSAPFSQIGEMGVFVREIENGLIEDRIDVAVHSLKDLQTDLPEGLMLGAVLERGWVRDTIVTVDGKELDLMSSDSIIGTSSARRRGLLASEKRGFDIQECRGNLQKRIKKLKDGQFDAIILAEAGLNRMGITDLSVEYLDVGRFVPAVGQGALGIEIRKDDLIIHAIVESINDPLTFNACAEEREFLNAIGGGCHAPIGGYLYYDCNDAVFLSFAGTTDGSWFARPVLREPISSMKGIGKKMAEYIKSLPDSDAFFREVNST